MNPSQPLLRQSSNAVLAHAVSGDEPMTDLERWKRAAHGAQAVADLHERQRDDMRADRDRYRSALEAIAERTCESTTDRIAREALDA